VRQQPFCLNAISTMLETLTLLRDLCNISLISSAAGGQMRLRKASALACAIPAPRHRAALRRSLFFRATPTAAIHAFRQHERHSDAIAPGTNGSRLKFDPLLQILFQGPAPLQNERDSCAGLPAPLVRR